MNIYHIYLYSRECPEVEEEEEGVAYLGMHRVFVFLLNRGDLLAYVIAACSHNITATNRHINITPPYSVL